MEFKLSAFIFILTFGVCLAQNSQPNDFFNNDVVYKCFEETSTGSNDSMSNVEEVSKVMIDGSRHFALQLFKNLNLFEAHGDGLIYSPTSIWSTLIITYLSSRGETELELKNKLKLKSYPKSSIALAYKGIRMWSTLKSKMSINSTRKTFISNLNKIFLSNELKVNKCFYDLFTDEVEFKNFRNRSLESLNEINRWVSSNTNGKINNLLAQGSITPMTKILITNAVYFKSVWATPFDPVRTKKEKFYVSPTKVIQTDMMSIDSTSLMYGISEELQATAVDVPYSNPDYSMLIILPHENKGLDSLIRDLSLSSYQALVNNLVDEEVNLVMPKFKAEKEFDLAGPLYSLGIKKIFDPRYVNISSLLTRDRSNDGVALDSVIHKSFIKVNEEGTEAAAATAMLFARSGRPAFPTQFIANRPFMFAIRDVSSNMILFLGTVRKPAAEDDD